MRVEGVRPTVLTPFSRLRRSGVFFKAAAQWPRNAFAASQGQSDGDELALTSRFCTALAEAAPARLSEILHLGG